MSATSFSSNVQSIDWSQFQLLVPVSHVSQFSFTFNLTFRYLHIIMSPNHQTIIIRFLYSFPFRNIPSHWQFTWLARVTNWPLKSPPSLFLIVATCSKLGEGCVCSRTNMVKMVVVICWGGRHQMWIWLGWRRATRKSAVSPKSPGLGDI